VHVPRHGTMFCLLLDTTFRFGFGLEHGCYATWLCLAFGMLSLYHRVASFGVQIRAHTFSRE
jgi:hypothetical protein